MLGKRIDPQARRLAVFLSTCRIGLGVGALLATRPALKALGFREAGGSSEALARLAGGRDLALGALTLLARNDPAAFRTLILAAAALDAADAFSLGHAARSPETRLVGIGGLASGGGAALAGLWAWRRLGDA